MYALKSKKLSRQKDLQVHTQSKLLALQQVLAEIVLEGKTWRLQYHPKASFILGENSLDDGQSRVGEQR